MPPQINLERLRACDAARTPTESTAITARCRFVSPLVVLCLQGLAYCDLVIGKQGLLVAFTRFVIGRLGVRVSPPAPSARTL